MLLEKYKKSAFSGFHKIVSLFLSVILVAPILVSFEPLKTNAQATEKEKNLVVILANNALFSNSPDNSEGISGKIYRYAQDIQSALPETRAMILPISESVDAGQVFAALEKMYLEGRKTEGTLFRLTGIVVVGQVELPLVRSAVGDMPSIFPWTDFEEPSFLWNDFSGVFFENTKSRQMQAEIFHGLIRAPENAEKSESEWLSEFFDKNHDFHLGKTEKPETALFSADFFHEYNSQNPVLREMYDAASGEFFDDLAFYRYNKNLLADVNNIFTQATKTQISEDLPESISQAVADMEKAALDFDIPDSLIRLRIRQLLPTFVGVVSGYLEKIDGLYKGSGRWIYDEKKVDFVPVLISEMDVLSREFLRKFSLHFEEKITQKAEDWQKPVSVFDSMNEGTSGNENGGGNSLILKNYFHGLLAADVDVAESCSLLRGSSVSNPRLFGENSQMAEMNHLYNVFPNDSEGVYKSRCSGYGGCCILNRSTPEKCIPDNATTDVFDFEGGHIQNLAKKASFEDCLRVNLKGARKAEEENAGLLLYFREGGSMPINTFHRISSVVVHDDPRPETISAALANGISGAIPADDPRWISWQGGGGNLVELLFFDLFSLEISPNESDEEILEKAKNLFSQKEKEIRYQLFLQNLFSYFAWISAQSEVPSSFSADPLDTELPPPFFERDPLPVSREFSPLIWKKAQFQFDDFESKIEEKIFQKYQTKEAFYADDNEDFFAEIQEIPSSLPSYSSFVAGGGSSVFLREILNQSNEEGSTILPSGWTEQFPANLVPPLGFLTGDDFSEITSLGGELLPEYLRWKSMTADEKHKRILQLFFSKNPLPISAIARESGYEMGTIHALGNAREFWWGGNDLAILPGDDPEWQEAQEETAVDSEENEEEIDECTGKPYSQGVPITEWLPAVACWLEKTLEKPFAVEMTNSCNRTGVMEFDEDADPEAILNTGIEGIPPGSQIFFEAPSVFPLNAIQDVTLRFEKLSGDLITSGVSFTATITGGEILHSDAVQSGSFSSMTFSGAFAMPVRIFSENAVLTVSAQGFPNASFSFSAISEGQISLQSLPIQEGDDLSLRRFALVFSDASGNPTDWYGAAYLTLSDSFAARLSAATVLVENGRGEFSLRMLGTAPVTITAFSDGFGKAEFAIAGGGEGSYPNRLFFKDPPDSLGIRESVDFEVVALDAVGREYSVEDADLKATTATEDLAKIENLGHGKFRINTLGKAGTLRLIARTADMASAVLEISIVLKMTREEIREAQFSAPILSFLGSGFGDFSEDGDPIANAALFSGSTQSVITSLNTNIVQYPRLSVLRGGALRVFDSTLESGVSTLSPPMVKVFDTQYSDTLLEYSLSFDSAEIRENFDLSQKNPDGIFVEILDRSGEISFAEETISFQENPGITLSSNGGITILDARFSVQFVQGGDYPVFSILFEGEQIGRIIFVGAKISLFSAPTDTTHFFPVPQNENGDRGFFVSGSGKALFLPDEGKSLERVNDDYAPGFHADDDNFALQIAAGTPVGEAAKYSFGPTGILLGDPSIALAPDEKQIGGFDRTLGHEVFRTQMTNITGLDSFDFDADNSTDILLGTQENRARVVKNLGSLQFRDLGDILESEFGFLSPSAGDFGGDGFDDISALTEENELLYFENSAEIIRKKTGYFLPDQKIEKLKIEDFDRDGNPDVLAKLSSGDLSIFWNDNGFSSNNKSVLGNFGLVVETSDIAKDNTLISFRGIQEMTDALFPLLLLRGVEEGEGIEGIEATAKNNGYDPSFHSDPDGVWAMLGGLKAKYPESFAQDLENEQESDISRFALFAPLEVVPGIVDVSLVLSDQNGGTLQSDDAVLFRLSVQNLTASPQVISLAHAIHSALTVDPNSLMTPEDWDRPIPTLEYLGEENTIRVRNISLLSGEKLEFSFLGKMRGQDESQFVIRENLALPDHPADGFPDVTLIVPGLSGLVHFLSLGNRQYAQIFDEGGEVDIPEILLNMEDSDDDGFPDKFIKDGDGKTDFSNSFFDPYKTDTDQDGIVDAWDETLGNLDSNGSDWKSTDKSIGDVADEILKYTKCDGGCLNLPFNFAFLVPGGINIFESLLGAVGSALGSSTSSGGTTTGDSTTSFPSLAGFGTGISSAYEGMTSAITETVEGVQDWVSNLPLIREAKGLLGGWTAFGWPIFGVLPHYPYVCYGTTCYPTSTFRLYLSPTLTGAVGIGICTGVGAPAGGNCIALAPSALNLAALCDAYDDEKKRVLGISEGGDCNIVSSGNSTNRVNKKDDSGFRGILYAMENIGSFSYSYNTGINRRVPMFPWNWIQAQVAEFFAMFQLPTIRVIYPDLSGISLDTFEDRFSELSKKDSSSSSKTENASSTFGNTVENKIQEIDDLYEALDAIPLLKIQSVRVPIRVPYLSREQILQFIDQLENFVDDLEQEIVRAKENWTGCSAEAPVSECSAEDVLENAITVHYEKLLSTARQNIEILKGYLNFPKMIASLDAMAAEWLSQVLCFLDNTVLYLASWFAKNKRRLELWIEAFYFLENILKIWESIKDIFVNYENYCSGCYADRGGLVMTIFNFIMSFVSLPIIEFPRLPDITLDASQIKGGIVIPLPKPQIHLVPILFPKLPRVRLPNSPSLDITLPSLPLLPTFKFPELPPFPSTPKFTLPDLPPAPMLPDLPAEIADFLQIAKVFLMLYCLYSSGIFPHSEATGLKSVIENITNRPVTAMLNVDLAGALFENIRIPSVREIRVIFQVNLDISIGDALVDALREAVKPINEISTDLRRSSGAVSRTLRDILNSSDQNGKKQRINLHSQDLPSEFQPIVDALLELQKEKDNHEIVLYSPDQLTAKYGLPAVNLPPVHPALPRLQELRGRVAQMHDDFKSEEKILLASNDLSEIHGRFVADSQFAAEVFDAKVDTSLVGLFPQRNRLLAEAMPLDLTKTYPLSDDSAPTNTITSPVQSTLGSLSPANSSFSSEEEVIQNTGIFAECGDGGEKILFSDIFEAIESVHSEDLDGDGDKDLLFQTRNAVFVKENHQIKAVKNFLSTPPEIGNFAEFAELDEAVKNIRVRSADGGVQVSFESHFTDDLLGIEVIARERKNGYFWDSNNSETVLTTLLLPTRFLPENPEKDFSEMTILVENQTFSGQILLQEFDRESVRIPLPQDRFWHIGFREIRSDAKSTLSEIFLGAPQEQRDLLDPIVTGDFDNETTLFEPIDLSIVVFDPGEKMPNDPGFHFWDDDDDFPEKKDPNDNDEDDSSDNLKDPDPPEEENPNDNDDSSNNQENPNSSKEENLPLDLLFNHPGSKVLPLTFSNPSGNTVQVNTRINVQSPEIFLDQNLLNQGLVGGFIQPRLAQFPFFVLRERDGETVKIFTNSAENSGKYRTDDEGGYRIPDFSFVSGAILSDAQGEFLAEIAPKNGRILIRSNAVSLSADSQEGGGISLVDDAKGETLARMKMVTDGNSDVRIFEDPLSAEKINNLPSGIFLFDRDPLDGFFAENLPGDAPSFAGGSALFDESGNIIAVVSRFGEARFLQENWTLSVQKSESEELPLVLEISDGEKVRFALLIKMENPEIFLKKHEEKPLSISYQESFSIRNHSPKLQETDTSFLQNFSPLFASSEGSAEGLLTEITPEFFTDVADTHRAASAIRALFHRKMVSGYGDGTFRPNELISRAEFIKLVIGAAQCRNCTDNAFPELLENIPLPFPDTPREAWYFFCVALAKFLGIVEGYGDGFLRPDQNISRAEAAAVLLRASKIPLKKVTSHMVLDVPETAWYHLEMLTAVELGFVEDHFGFLFPEEKITRGEFAIMAEKALEINSCTMLRPADTGILNDHCPAVPEDRDGVDDEDGCPEFDFPGNFSDLSPGIYLSSDDLGTISPQFQFSADIRKNDRIFTAILSDDESEIFSQSQIYEIPETFSPVAP